MIAVKVWPRSNVFLLDFLLPRIIFLWSRNVLLDCVKAGNSRGSQCSTVKCQEVLMKVGQVQRSHTANSVYSALGHNDL